MNSVRLVKSIKLHEGNEIFQGGTKDLNNISVLGEAEVKIEDNRPVDEIYAEVSEKLNTYIMKQLEENIALKDALMGKESNA